MTSNTEIEFFTAIGIVPLSIAEYNAVDELCVYMEPKFRTSPLDTNIDGADYKRQLENRINNLSAKSDRPSMSLAAGPDEWRAWTALKSKAQRDAIDSARLEISDALRGLSLASQPTTQIEDAQIEEPDDAIADSKTDEVLPAPCDPKGDFIRATDALLPSLLERQRQLAIFVKSVDQFALFEAANYESGDTSTNDLAIAAAPFVSQ